MERLVQVEHNGSAAILTIIHPPVNVLSRGVAAALLEAVRETVAERLVVTGAGKLFAAGADIREIENITLGLAPPQLSYLNELLNFLEQQPRPVIMALQGSAFGIGLELAMAGHYRIAHPGTQLGLPEVKLGLIPGAGGTQRLPRLIGPSRALHLIETGEPIPALLARQIGLVDEVDENPVARALHCPPGRVTSQLIMTPSRGFAAVAAATQAFSNGLAVEESFFRDALQDPAARAHIYLFFAEREAAKLPFLNKDLPPGDAGKIESHPSPNGRAVELRFLPESTNPADFHAAWTAARQQGQTPIACLGPGPWLGAPDLSPADARAIVDQRRVVRPSDLDLLMVRGYGYPAHLGGPLYSTTPSQISVSLREPLK
jgi:enoyl-CoA hydratase/carnithine racemase